MAIVTDKWWWSAQCMTKQDRGGQRVNVFSMALHMAMGRDKVDRLTPRVKRSAHPPERYSRLSPISAGDPEESPSNPHITPGSVRSTSCAENGWEERQRKLSWQDVLWFPRYHFTPSIPLSGDVHVMELHKFCHADICNSNTTVTSVPVTRTPVMWYPTAPMDSSSLWSSRKDIHYKNLFIFK